DTINNWHATHSIRQTISVLGGIVYGILYIVKSVNDGLESTKASLKSKGLDISSTGVSVKTSRRFDREDYVDATQRGIIKAMGAASFRKNAAASSPDVAGVPPAMERQTSSTSSVNSTDSIEKKKKRFGFGKK
ncbi:hypothetical protein CVT26_005051, partial [Gymnopilus dilepis]